MKHDGLEKKLQTTMKFQSIKSLVRLELRKGGQKEKSRKAVSSDNNSVEKK